MNEITQIKLANTGIELREPMYRALYKLAEKPIFELTDNEIHLIRKEITNLRTEKHGQALLNVFCKAVEDINSKYEYYDRAHNMPDADLDGLRDSFSHTGPEIKKMIYEVLEFMNRDDLDPNSRYEPTDENDYIYSIDVYDDDWESQGYAETGATILSYLGSSNSPRVPSTLGGYNVLGVWAGAFDGSSIERIKLPETLIKIF